MKYVRVEYDGEISYGVLKENGVQLLAGDIFGQASLTDTLLPLEKVRLLAPCCPFQAVCVGLNSPGPCRGDEHPPARGAGAVFKALHRAGQPRRRAGACPPSPTIWI